ncbi:HipA-like protein [Actinoplanes lutulentus]|uniref:HipA-like protein n=1 Tax=Actinoplanes lutulentus TaxID=1287878 RepID=A0A327ZDT9_9ACTN|nr:HipA N-terminal domain-containing protein [Actinoplanes lutulentus]MBB2941580.1 HipA-like protein [Actinoplanes lutulentus]RAK39500.1 HipA-like protein [Actinoplanes lutulentus]
MIPKKHTAMPGESSWALTVRLHDVVVGEIVLSGNTARLTLNGEYLRMPSRPVLGQTFEDDPERARNTHQRLTPWFSNLLPEKGGPLRDIIARQLGIHPEREFFLLAGLGHDLPGAVTALPAEPWTDVPDTHQTSLESELLDRVRLKFSLAGIQLKLSLLKTRRGLTLPASGEGGDWIVKLPFHDFGKVPENEYSMMLWLKESGVDVPAIDLFPAAEVQGVPEGLVDRPDPADSRGRGCDQGVRPAVGRHRSDG